MPRKQEEKFAFRGWEIRSAKIRDERIPLRAVHNGSQYSGYMKHAGSCSDHKAALRRARREARNAAA